MERFIKIFFLVPLCLLAHGENPRVMAGHATFENEGSTQTITTDDKTVIHFTKFNLAPDEQTKFVQPSNRSSVLCRMTGKEPSNIRGRLESNGRLLLINPYGILFSETATVHVGTLIASTLNIKDRDFLRDNYKFFMEREAQNSAIVNQGQIVAEEQAVFMASQIFNQGTILAHAGRVELLGGEMITLSFDSDGLISFVIDAPLKEGVIEQAGQIVAQEVFVNLKTAHQLIKDVVNVHGLVEASKIEVQNGVVRLVRSIEADTVHIAGHAVESNGDLSMKGVWEMESQKEIRFNGKLEGTSDLTIKSASCTFMEDAAVSSLNVACNGPITFLAGKPTLFTAGQSIELQGTHLFLSPGTDLSFMAGSAALPPVKASNCNLSVSGKKGSVEIGKIEGVNHLILEGKKIVLNGQVDLHDAAFAGPVSIEVPDKSFTIIAREGNIHFKSTCKGSVMLNLEAPKGKIVLDNQIDLRREKDRLTSIHLNGKLIDQNSNLRCEGQIVYTADRIYLGGDVRSFNNDIVFNGPVIFDNTNVINITTGFTKGNVIFQTTVDADRPSRAVVINNGKSSGSVFFYGGIGVNNPLGDLKVNTSRLTLHNIGGKNAGVAKHLDLTAEKFIDCFGTIHNAGQQTWSTPCLTLKGQAYTSFITNGLPMVFSGMTKLLLEPHASVNLETRGGILELSKLSGQHHQAVTINTGHGQAQLGEIEGLLDNFQVRGRDIILSGRIDVGAVFIEAEQQIRYKSESTPVYQTSILSRGDITLNAKHGMIGTSDYRIYIKAQGNLYIGAESFAYLEGTCAAGYPHLYPKNPVPRMFFNDNEYQYIPFKEYIEEDQLMSLAPDLAHKKPDAFIDISSLTPRPASIYYQSKTQ